MKKQGLFLLLGLQGHRPDVRCLARGDRNIKQYRIPVGSRRGGKIQVVIAGRKHPEPELTIDFGRPVEIDKLVVVVRYNVRQGGYWKEATVEFSDGSKVTIKPEYNGKRQEFPIKKRVVTSMKITKLVINIPKKYAALVEVEAWGKPAPKPKKTPNK